MTATDAFPLALSLRVAGLALVIVAPLGLGLAWIQARKRYLLRRVVDALVLLPLVLPPSVVGFVLVLVFGRHGAVGHALERIFGIRLVFTPAAAVIASALVALPMMVKAAQPAFEAVPRELEEIAASLGLSPGAVFVRVSLPLAWRGVLAGLVLAFARAMGEFGATLMFAGDVPGRTNTMPIEIFTAFQGGDDARALIYVGVLCALSCLVVAAAAWLSPKGVQP